MLVIADVSGKGIPAALLVSSLHAYLSAYLESTMSLVEIVARLNTAIHRASTDDKFITAFFAMLDPVVGIRGMCECRTQYRLLAAGGRHRRGVEQGGDTARYAGSGSAV